ncbi:transposase [Sutterella wadsworthensis]|uniref:IS1634 family transposase n=1 Tax=Sutterella wadsworthensis TaxID=40545 RepID=UPI003A910C2A
MGRPLTGKTHVGIRRETRSNGDVYVYERVTGYDQKTKTLSTRLLGKILAGSTEMIPTRPKKKRSEVIEAPVQAVRTHVGLQKILEWAGHESGIDADLQRSFEIGDALKLSSIARYWVATDGDTLPRMESWQVMNPLPYGHPITQDVYGKLFASVGRNESGVQSYFQCRGQRVSSTGLNLALDTTTFSTYSKNQIEARQGFNKDGDGLDTIKLLVLYSVENRQPVAFSKQPGNIPDKISLANALRQLDMLDLASPVIVADNGFYSQDNMTHFAREHTKFLMLANSTDKWVRSEIDAAREELGHFRNVCPFDVDVSGVMRRRQHGFSIVRKRTRGNFEAGETESFTRRLYVHVFHKPEAAPIQERRLRESLFSLKKDLEDGVEEFRPAAQKQIDSYLTVKRTAKGVKVDFKMDGIEEAKRYWGYFVLVSNEIKDPFDALKAYRSREKIEELFATYKDSFDGRKPRTWYPENLYGRQFAQFVGLGYHCFLAKRILDVKKALSEKETEGKTKEELSLEAKLLAWLNQHSLIQILDWFRCVDYVAATGNASASKWTTETTRRDQLFLKMLGVK